MRDMYFSTKKSSNDRKFDKEYLLCYSYDPVDEYSEENMGMGWDIYSSREALIDFLRGLTTLSDIAIIDYDASFILVNDKDISLGDRISLKEFIDHINKDLDDPIVYE